MRLREILNRIKRLERQLQPKVVTTKDIEVMQRRNGSGPDQIVMRLHAARTRMRQENELARQTAAAAAALEESKITEA